MGGAIGAVGGAVVSAVSQGISKGFDNISWKKVGSKAVEWGTYGGTAGLTMGASVIASMAIGGAGMALGDTLGQGIDKGFENVNLKSVLKSGGIGLATAGMGQAVAKVAGKVGSTVAAKASKYVGEAGKKIVEQVATGYTMGASMGATADAVSQTFDIANGTQQGGYDLFQTLKSTFYGGVAGSVATVGISKLASAAGKLKAGKASNGELQEGIYKRYLKDGSSVMDLDNLPGENGINVSRRLTIDEMSFLTEEYGVEFALTYKLGPGKNGGGGQYKLFSGEINKVKVPFGKDIMQIYHTHPGGSIGASAADRNILFKAKLLGSPQRSSRIIPMGRRIAVSYDENGTYGSVR